MITVNGQVTGGQAKNVELEEGATVADLQAAMNLEGSYTATVNGEPASASDVLEAFSFVAFAESVKGGM